MRPATGGVSGVQCTWRRSSDRDGMQRSGAAAGAHAAPSWFGVSGSEAGFPDDDHSFIRCVRRRFGRMACVDGAMTRHAPSVVCPEGMT
ncbi:hypothetical protein EMIT0111MI5_11233 [Burkholderia sp. IT-111MI5]